MKTNFFLYCIVFIILALLSNWFWFPEYILAGLLVATSIIIVIGFVIGVKNMINDNKPDSK